MTISLVISIVCVILFLIFIGLLCFLFIRKQRHTFKTESDTEHAVSSAEESSEIKPPRRKRSQRFHSNAHSHHQGSPGPLPVPFNSPSRDSGSVNRKRFQPMNFDEKTRRKREKRRRRKEEMIRDKDKDKVTRQKSESHEYFKAKVHVTPLKFSEKNYTKNEITEKLFAGSIHIGYTENETTLESPTENVNAQRFTSWRDLFDEKMKLEE